MARELGRWFRFYDAVLDDPKVQRLSDQLFRAWVNLMCLANRNGGVIADDFASIAFSLRVSEGKARDIVQALMSANLIDRGETDYAPHNWNDRQFKSDVSTDRVNRFRERQRNVSGNVSSNVAGNTVPPLRETAPETDTESDTEQSRKKDGAAAPRRPKGTRWPADAVVPGEWIERARDMLAELRLPPIDFEAEAKGFALYWSSATKNPTKLDWEKTWLNRVLEVSKNAALRGKSRGGQPGQLSQIEELQRIAQQSQRTGSD